MKQKTFTLAAGTADESVLVTTQSCQGLQEFKIDTLTGSVEVLAKVSAGAENRRLVLSQEPGITGDSVDAQEGTLVAVTTVGKIAYFYGDYHEITVRQVGATAATATMRGVGPGL